MEAKMFAPVQLSGRDAIWPISACQGPKSGSNRDSHGTARIGRGRNQDRTKDPIFRYGRCTCLQGFSFAAQISGGDPRCVQPYKPVPCTRGNPGNGSHTVLANSAQVPDTAQHSARHAIQVVRLGCDALPHSPRGRNWCNIWKMRGPQLTGLEHGSKGESTQLERWDATRTVGRIVGWSNDQLRG